MELCQTDGAQSDLDLASCMKWTPQELTQYLNDNNVPVGDIFIKNKIDGSIVFALSEKDYHQLGFATIGEKVKVQIFINKISKKARSERRDHSLWQKTEYVDKNCCEKVFHHCACVKRRRDDYKLTTSNLIIRHTDNGTSCKCCRSCYTKTQTTDNIGLDKVTDIDFDEVQPNCCDSCCGYKGFSRIILSHIGADVSNDHTELFLERSEGEKVQRMIRDAVAESGLYT